MAAARAAAFKVPDAAELARTGLTADDYAEDTRADVWPENWPVWALWLEVRNQWRVGMNGAYALDYTPLFMRMDKLGLSNADWNEMFADLRVVEATTLDEMRKP